jgi:hypothetical protein
MRYFCGILAGVLLVGTLGTTPAAAQTASRLGASLTAISAVVKGSAVAYDPKNSIYLVVSAYGDLNGRFVSAGGDLIGVPFTIQSGAAGFTHFPGVAYSPDANGGAGGFLVAWHQSVTSGAVVHARMVTSSGVLGPESQISADGSWWEAAVDVAYSTVSHEFLVVWQAAGIRGQRVGLNGETLGANIFVTGTDYHRDPSVAYNPAANEYMVVYSGADAVSAYAAARRVAPGSGALLGTETLLNRAGGTYITDVAYNAATNQYLAAWYQGGTYGRLLDAAGNVVSNVLLLATRFTAYDGLGMDYNTSSGTFLMVSHDQSSYQDGAVELSGPGAVPDIGFVATSTATTNGNFYPKIAARTGQKEWLMSTATSFTATTVQRLQSTASGGGGGTVALPPPPPPPPPPTTAGATAAKGDFSNDGKADIIWQRDDGYLAVWNMNGASMMASPSLNPGRVSDPAWRIVATGDLNGDGQPDIVWQHMTAGWLSVWFMNGRSLVRDSLLVPNRILSNDWHIVAAADMNGDGKADLIWQHMTAGWLAVWYMDGATVTSDRLLTPGQIAGNDWKIVGAGDFNGDGRPDLVWQHTSAGLLCVWLMSGSTLQNAVYLNPSQVTDPAWHIRGVIDLNGDGQTDLLWQHDSGYVGAWFMNGTTLSNAVLLNPPSVSGGWQVMGPR